MALRDELVRQGDYLFHRRTYAPLVLGPLLLIALRHYGEIERVVGDGFSVWWTAACAAVALIGVAIRSLVGGHVPAFTSGRSNEEKLAASLNTTGMYSVVRHPLYLGNFLSALGVMLATQVWWFVVIACLAFWLYYERIMLAEEAFLEQKFGATFLEWARNTPCFWPRRSGWRQPPLPFSAKTALRKEFSGFFLIVAAFELVDILGKGLARGAWEIDSSAAVVLVAGFLAYSILALLKRRTQFFFVEGR